MRIILDTNCLLVALPRKSQSRWLYEAIRDGVIEVDKDDNKFVDCAVASQANFIITHDRHFNILKTIEFPSVKCLTIAEFKIIFDEILSK